MSGSTAKFERREIRKAFGEVAITTLDKQAHALIDLRDHTREAFAAQRHDASETARLVTQLRMDHDEIAALLKRPFFGKLKWLFTGQ